MQLRSSNSPLQTLQKIKIAHYETKYSVYSRGRSSVTLATTRLRLQGPWLTISQHIPVVPIMTENIIAHTPKLSPVFVLVWLQRRRRLRDVQWVHPLHLNRLRARSEQANKRTQMLESMKKVDILTLISEAQASQWLRWVTLKDDTVDSLVTWDRPQILFMLFSINNRSNALRSKSPHRRKGVTLSYSRVARLH